MKAFVLLTISICLFYKQQAQNIKVYFNQSVDNSVSVLTDAKTSSHLDDTICALINSATATLDMAVWDNGSTKIVTAINNAYTRGVLVRYISSTNSTNTALSGLNANIPLLKRSSVLTSNVMHNKFIVVDNTKLLMGSMNFGNGSMFNDYNNVVMVSNTGLAQNYTIEFNEMWGSSGATPNNSNSKFGPAKTDNTLHSFSIGGISVESYFSPTDNTTVKMVNAINSANYSLDIAMFTFTNNDLGDAVVAAKNRGVNVRCIIENVSYFGSEYNKLVNAGIAVISHENSTYDFHHKYCIIDAVNASSDPIVVTGSHNWTNSAEDEYDENTLMIHDVTIANQYLEEYTKRYTDLAPVGINEFSTDKRLIVYPNPNKGTFRITSNLKDINTLQVINTLGEVVYVANANTMYQNNLISLDLKQGIYFVQIVTNTKTILEKVIVE